MESESCQSRGSYQSSELDENDPAFAKTPIRPDSDCEDNSDDSDSSDVSEHFNEHGNKTYFHVWSDMLTCNEMSALDVKAANEEPKYVEGDEKAEPLNVHKPLSIDTSLPCPLIQFGPVPKRRPKVPPAPTTSEKAASDPKPATTGTDTAGDTDVKHKSCRHDRSKEHGGSGGIKPGEAGSASSQEHDERCCDFSVVAAKNNARLKQEAKLRRLERKRLIRY